MLSFPRDFPSFCHQVTGQTRLVYQQSRAITGGASPNVADLGPSFWRTVYSFDLHGRSVIAAFSAWCDTLRGGLKLFKGIPIRGGRLYRWPLTRPRGFAGLTVGVDAWAGLGNLEDIAVGNNAITIDEMPNGLVLSPGDFLSFAVGSRQHLHKVVEGGTVSGNEVTVTVEPLVRPDAEADVAVRFEYPYCDMSLTSEIDMPEDQRTMARLSFQAVQALI